MLVKCICINCSGHLEFEEENAGEQIKCPHCGWETTLYEGEMPVVERESDKGILAKLKRHWRVLSAAAALILVVGGISFAVYHWVFPWLQEMFPGLEGGVIPILTIVLSLWVFVAAIAWTAFPIIVFLQLRQITTAIRQLQSPLVTPALPVTVAPKEEVEAEIPSEETEALADAEPTS